MIGGSYPGQAYPGWSPITPGSDVTPPAPNEVTEAFKTAARQPIKAGVRSSIQVINEAGDGIEDTITGEELLVRFKIEATSGLLTTTMRKLSVKLLGTEHDFISRPTYVRPLYGLKLADDSWEDINYGTFLVTEQTVDHETGTMTFSGYDLMIKSYIEYAAEWHTYPSTLAQFVDQICNGMGVANGAGDTFTHSGLYIDIDYYAAISGITYRDILEDIAEATATTIMIGWDDTLYLKPITETDEELDETLLKKFKAFPPYGPINSVVLSRMPQEDNIALTTDDVDQIAEGLTEVKIVNNELLDKRREDTIQTIYDAVSGTTFYPFDVTTIGLGWYQVGDRITILNSGTEYSSVVYNYVLELDGALKERLYTNEQTKTTTNYQRAGDITKHIRNTEIVVDKQQGFIESLVSDMYGEDGLVNTNYTQILQDLTSIITSVQNAGGNNLIKNSAGYILNEDGTLQDWEVTGTPIIEPSADAVTKGSLSGNIITLEDATIVQRVSVSPDNSEIPEEQKTYYTFAVLVKKDAVGTGTITLSNAIESHVLEFESGEDPNYELYSIDALLPLENYYDITITGSTDSNFTVTDMILAVGQYKTQWQQANGEFANTQVQINIDGVTVRSSTLLGTYTKQTPLAFSGWKDGDQVFSIDVNGLQVKKALVAETIEMAPIKLVKMSGGIAFVAGTEE